ncbi:hypothetical protein XU18_0827 [Perkinsela sp. CCAP 1560/4]|nr:hypothetical protein XU18_0827 [Perkinsela sp. CCAP 1560/4]|eukprot:KNH08707.1 hypothetical protein XU18_0827 [Perkinsela sp. CCAP 1560/4]
MYLTFQFVKKDRSDHAFPVTQADWQECEIVYSCDRFGDAKIPSRPHSQWTREIQLVFRGVQWVGTCSFAQCSNIDQSQCSSSIAVFDNNDSPQNVYSVKLYPTLFAH